MERAGAYEQLRSDPIALRQPEVQTALLHLLDRENHVVESALRESHEQVGRLESTVKNTGNMLLNSASQLMHSRTGMTHAKFAMDGWQLVSFLRTAFDVSSGEGVVSGFVHSCERNRLVATTILKRSYSPL